MKKIYIQNLSMIITEKCNLDCKHCMRGVKCDHSMSDEVIKKTLEQVGIIGNLCICGGEPTMALDVLEKIFSYVIDNHIIVDMVTVVINGTIYSEKFLKLLDMMEEYVSFTSYDKVDVHNMFKVSYDDYHLEEIEKWKLTKLYFENLRKYKESKYYAGIAELDPNLKLFDEGNASFLDSGLTTKLKPYDIAVSYVGGIPLIKKGLCNIGPLITVNTDGIITESNASTVSQKRLYNYGNVFDNTIEEIALERGKIIKPRRWYKECERIVIEQSLYNK